MTTQRQATEGTQAHNDIANQKMNIRYYMECQEMSREEAKKFVENLIKKGAKLKTNEEINRAIAAEKKRRAAVEKREAAKKKEWENMAKKAEEEAKKKGEPKTEEEAKPKGSINNKSIGISVNGVQYSSICAGMKAHGIPDKGTKNWFKIRAALKKSTECAFESEGTVYTFIQL